MKKKKNLYPLPPYSYSGFTAPEYALVGKPISNEQGNLITFQLVLENTKTGQPADPDQMKAFLQAILNKFNQEKN